MNVLFVVKIYLNFLIIKCVKASRVNPKFSIFVSFYTTPSVKLGAKHNQLTKPTTTGSLFNIIGTKEKPKFIKPK